MVRKSACSPSQKVHFQSNTWGAGGTNTNQNDAIQAMKCDISILKARIAFFESRCEAVDQTMLSEIETTSNDELTKMALIELWLKECKEEEGKPKELWKDKEEWLLMIEVEQTQDETIQPISATKQRK